MAERTDLQKLIARKHTLEDLISAIAHGRRLLTPQNRHLLRTYKDELGEVNQAIALERARAS